LTLTTAWFIRRAFYFAENSCKSHKYSEANTNDDYWVLFCRVLLGGIYTTPEVLGTKKRPDFDGKL
jgi:hypothetical protein